MAYRDIEYNNISAGDRPTGPLHNQNTGGAPIVDGAEVVYDGLRYDALA